MPPLSEKLKSLGVKIGARDLHPAPTRDPRSSIEKILSGRSHHTHMGETFVIEQVYPASHQHGQMPLQVSAPMLMLSKWAADDRICELAADGFAFLDTETTGLSGGAGTYAFLIGVGRFVGEEFHLAQFFMHDPIEEPAQLYALEEFLAPCQALVTYNGKSFDIPLLAARYTTHGWRAPFSDYAHIDLLHLSRRIWRDRLPSRTLGNIEAHILGTQRSEEDVPGWMIPQMYFDYLRSGDAGPLRSVFYHNAMDVVSLATLLDYSAALLDDPSKNVAAHGVDILSVARIYEELGDLDRAIRLYIDGLEHPDVLAGHTSIEIILNAMQRLALIYKRSGDFDSAIPLWIEAAQHGHLDSNIELAKFYEHQTGDYNIALHWTENAIEQMDGPAYSQYQHRRWLPVLQHRKSRLLRKLGQ